MKTRNVLIALVAVVVVFGMSGSAVAQTGCFCTDLGECAGSGIWSTITNLEDPKPPDLVLCANDAYPVTCAANWPGLTQDVTTVQDAIDAIQAGGDRINVLVQGHGESGIQCFGTVWSDPLQDCGDLLEPVCDGACPDGQFCLQMDTTGDEIVDDCKCGTPQCIGNDAPYAVDKAHFIEQVSGKIKTLTLLGCSAAAEPDGEGFLAKLATELRADHVKGWSGTNRVVLGGGVYETEGEKITTPTVSEWGLIAVTLSVMTLGTIMLGRRRKPAVA